MHFKTFSSICHFWSQLVSVIRVPTWIWVESWEPWCIGSKCSVKVPSHYAMHLSEIGVGLMVPLGAFASEQRHPKGTI